MSRGRWAVLLLVAAVAFSAAYGWRMLQARLHTPHAVVDRVDVKVRPGMNARQIATLLEDAGVVEDARLFVGWLWWTEQAGSIQAGEYRFDRPYSVVEVAEVLISGRVLLHPVTIPEGSTRWQVARALAAAGFGTYDEAFDATGRFDLIEDIDPNADSLEGYMLPDTYLAPASSSALDLVGEMVAAFREIWTWERAVRTSELEMTMREVVTLASLIEAETPAADEREVVSAVFHNRLRRGMRLQTDPTVIYARRLAGLEGRTIHVSDLERDSPYNTYRVMGLPLGPIGNPRVDSIDAALNPADVDFLYFVSRNDGTHVFSRTLAEHNRSVQQYQR